MPNRIRSDKNILLPLKFFLLVLLMLFWTNSHSLLADEVRYYDFEIIVFESNDQEARLSEVWKNTIQIEAPEKFIHLNSPYPGPMPSQYSPKLTFKRLPKSSYRLKPEAKMLTENDKNKILLHTSWRQPGMPADTALPIHFKRNFINTITPLPETSIPGQPVSAPGALTADAADIVTPSASHEVVQSKSILEGYIRIVLLRYLHADVNLTYTTGLPLASTTTLTTPGAIGEHEEIAAVRPPSVFQLQQTRKMRSKEVHYLDHPVLGFIILATPYLGKTLKAR